MYQHIAGDEAILSDKVVEKGKVVGAYHAACVKDVQAMDQGKGKAIVTDCVFRWGGRVNAGVF